MVVQREGLGRWPLLPEKRTKPERGSNTQKRTGVSQ